MKSSSRLLDEEEMGAAKDWRKALRSQPAYRIVNKTIRGQTQFISFVGLTGLFILIFLYVSKPSSSRVLRSSNYIYNYTYPLTKPIKTGSKHIFRIGIIADLDTKSKSTSEENTWFSYFKTGYLVYNYNTHEVVINWDNNEPIQLKNNYALKGRGMELSELVVFDGKLLTFDDRTGLVFEIVNNKVIPWVLLMDGDGRNKKGFKSEWATVKDEVLYVGSMGKEWTTPDGEYENSNPQYIKTITPLGQINHINWVEPYNRISQILGINPPGYMIHESGVWSAVHRRWFFLPRRCSKERYNESLDEQRGCSVLISANEDLHDLKAVRINNARLSRGFSSFKFIPTSNDYVIVALRTEELDGKTASYFTSFTIEGKVLIDDLLISDLKYEGLEFI